MLKELSLQNFVIAKSCSISFGMGFNVLSGETGTGKTMLMQALALLLGQKADTKVIRTGEEKAWVQARFEDCDLKVYECLIEAGIEIEDSEDVLISRELNLSGKNRIFINSQPAALPLLKTLAPYLIELISQHSQLLLKDPTMQRELLDAYACLTEECKSHQKSFAEEEELKKTIRMQEEKIQAAHQHLPLWKEALEEIKAASIQENEEETLFHEYKKLSHLQDILKLGGSVLAQLSENPSSVLEALKKLQRELKQLIHFDKQLSSIEQALESSYDLLSDASFEISRYLSSLEQEPERFQEIEHRLAALKALYKKYGRSFTEIQKYQTTLISNIEDVSSLEVTLEQLKKELAALSVKRRKQSIYLSEQRMRYAKELSNHVTEHLHELNMHHARFKIERKETAVTPFGCDEISFDLAANLGEGFYAIKDHASGGELSRILFTLKLILAEKEKKQTLIFDEIDANIGGVTASLLGKKLHSLGLSRQVICITHFPQVAAHADHHMQMNKVSLEGRMITEVKILSTEEKQEELLRMMGGTSLTEQILKESSNLL